MSVKTLIRAVGLAFASLSTAAPSGNSGPLPIDKPLIASWTFDEITGNVCRDTSGNGCDASTDPTQPGFERVAGIFDGGLNFSGRHLLRCGEKPAFGALPKLSFSVWVQPAAFEQYNEIFRKEDGNNRVLFSFQERGHVLSLGLNVNGYVECDAKLDPAQVTDGVWHHAAATFDGHYLRVYLDGSQIGQLERPGSIAAGGPARACIGSANGGETFRGQMDELRIYADALTAEEVARLYRDGVEALARSSGPVQALVDSIYSPGKSFAETLSSTRSKVAEQGVRLDAKAAALLLQRLRANYPEECKQFQLWTGVNPGSYLRSKGNEFHLEAAGRLVEMLTEYKPLTEQQRAKQSAEDQRQWNEALPIERKLQELKARGNAAQFSPEWIDLIFEAGRKIVWRPQEQEAVAPYASPKTPETRNLTAAEARQALERDWLFQADGKPTAERIRSEIQWTRELAARLGVAPPSELALLEKAEASPATYFKVRELKRQILFRNPLLDFNKIVFVDMPYPGGKEWQHETRHRLGYMAVPGARLLVLEGLAPDGKLRQLMPQAPLHGSFWRPDVSFDGKRVLFCFKPHNEKSFHLYEIQADGSGLRQITDGIFDDLDPVYTPDGQLVFSTTRGHTYVRCMPPTNAFVLARCDPDGGNMYFISSNNEPDYLPSVLPDGRLVYTRWEYTDKPLWRAQKLWTVNPDGTGVQTLWGNQSVWPDVVKDARAIPGSHRVMMTGSAHHNWFAGSVGIIDPTKGFNFPNGLTKVTADVIWPECGNGPIDPIESPRYHPSGSFTAYYSPYPLSERDFLVSAKRGETFALYLMDTDGNRELIYEGAHNIFHAIPLKPRLLPPTIPDRVVWPGKHDREHPKHGVFFSNNVYEGAPAELQSKAKFLRVLHIEPKTYTYWHKRPALSTGPVVSTVQSEGVKRLLGTVPIQADGSVAFQAPSGLSLHFQLLDERHRALQTMRSFANLMPGEYRGCLGCHESHSKAPASRSNSLAMAKPPQAITPPPWKDTTVSYTRYVRPVLDQYCAKCHTGEAEGRKALDVSFRPGFLDWDETYYTLIGRPTWGKAYETPKDCPPGFGIADTILVEGYEKTDPAAYATPAPMQRLSFKSRLIELASSGKHYEVRVDDVNLQRLICWVDTMCPYRGDEEVREEPDPVFQGVDWLAIRPKIQTAPHISRPGPVE